MAIPRFLIPSTHIDGHRGYIDDPREIHHARDVLRLAPGSRCVVFDGHGSEWEGRVTEITAVVVRLEITAIHVRQQAACPITIVQALPKLPAFETILRQATELGVARIVPVVTQRSVVRMPVDRWSSKLERWERIIAAAAKQTRRADVPTLCEPLRWPACLARESARPGLHIMPTLERPGHALAHVLSGQQAVPDALTIYIGPEGDFCVDEVQSFTESGGQLASLGSFVLKADTAVAAVVAVLQSTYVWGRA